MVFHNFQVPFTLCIAGPTSCGKSTFLKQLLTTHSNQFSKKFAKILYCYGEAGSKPRESIPGVTYHRGMPEEMNNPTKDHMLVIYDDLMVDGLKSKNDQIVKIFVQGMHHQKISAVLIVQNLFFNSPHMRTISLNSTYIIAFKNPRNMQQIGFLARQIAPHQSKEIESIFNDATKKCHSYMLFDMSQTIDERLRFRTDVLNPHYCICYTNTDGEQTTLIDGEEAYLIDIV